MQNGNGMFEMEFGSELQNLVTNSKGFWKSGVDKSQYQKQPPRGVPSKRCSERYWNHTSALLKSHFGMGVLL